MTARPKRAKPAFVPLRSDLCDSAEYVNSRKVISRAVSQHASILITHLAVVVRSIQRGLDGRVLCTSSVPVLLVLANMLAKRSNCPRVVASQLKRSA